MFIGRTDVEAEIPILWPPGEKSQLIGKNSDAGIAWRIPGTGEPGEPPSMGSHRVGHD